MTDQQLRNECNQYLASPATYAPDKDALLDAIEYALDKLEYASAWILIGAALARFGDDQYVVLHLAYLLYEEEQYDYARVVLGRVAEPDYWLRSLQVLIDVAQDPETARDGIVGLVDATGHFDNETLDNLITVGRDTDNFELIAGLVPKIASRAESPAHLWRQMAVWAREIGDYDHQVMYVEKYVDADPYNKEAWEMRTQVYFDDVDNLDEAITSAEYALAIDPESATGQLAILDYGIFNYHGGGDIDVSDMVSRIRHGVDATPEYADMFLDRLADLAMAFGLDGNSEIEAALYEFNKLHPDNSRVTELILQLSERRGEWEIQEFVMKQFVEAIGRDANFELLMLKWTNDLFGRSMPYAAMTVRRVFYDECDITYESCLSKKDYLAMLYSEGRYEAIDDIEDPSIYLSEKIECLRLLMHKSLAAARRRRYEAAGDIARQCLRGISLNNGAICMNADDTIDVEGFQRVSEAIACWSDSRPRTKRGLDGIDPYMPLFKLRSSRRNAARNQRPTF